jgi:hypothetical protein
MSQSLIGADSHIQLMPAAWLCSDKTLPLVAESRLGLVVFCDAPVEAESVPIPL